jgi:cytoskeletal protein CcmA (bactofilin family)
MRKSFPRILLSGTLLALLALSIAIPASAFDGRSGDTITIAAGETVDDDLYVTANTVVVDGTIKGDLIALGQTITVNGTVEGDVMAAGQAVIINGTVMDDVRIAGSALFVGENAKIGGDVISAGGSLELRKGSSLGRDVVFAGGQALFAGDIVRNVDFAGGGLELRGTIGGSVKAEVGNPDESNGGASPAFFMPQTGISMPVVKTGLTIDPAAKIGGSLNYTSTKQLSIPAGVVSGKITRAEPTAEQRELAKQPTATERVVNGTLDILRRIVTLILFGLLLVWLLPAVIRTGSERIKTAPLPSFGWGIVAFAAFFLALMVVVIATILGGVIFGSLTLGSLSGTIIWLGIFALFALILGFVLAASFVAQVVVSALGGQLILARFSPSLSEHKVWPLVLGVVIFALLSAIPILGGLVRLIVVLLGLGALWFYGRELLVKKPAT